MTSASSHGGLTETDLVSHILKKEKIHKIVVFRYKIITPTYFLKSTLGFRQEGGTYTDAMVFSVLGCEVQNLVKVLEFTIQSPKEENASLRRAPEICRVFSCTLNVACM